MSKNKPFFLLCLVLFFALLIVPARGYLAQANQGAGSAYLPLVIKEEAPIPPGDPNGSFVFVSWADTKSGKAALASLSGQVKKLNPVFTFYPGDLEGSGFTTSGMNSWKDALNAKSSGGSGQGNGMFDITLPLRGNHDNSNPSGWKAYFDTAAVASRVGAGHFSALSDDQTYSFDYHNSLFIGIDVPGDASLITSAQVAYLDSSLAGAESRGLTHAFIFFHGPIYTISSHTSCGVRVCPVPASIVSLIKVINKHPIVSAVFNGHEHLQARVHMDSSRVPEITHPFEEFITGSAGAELYPCNKSYRFDYCGSFPGFAAVSVSGQSWTVDIYQQGKAGPVKTYTFGK